MSDKLQIRRITNDKRCPESCGLTKRKFQYRAVMREDGTILEVLPEEHGFCWVGSCKYHVEKIPKDVYIQLLKPFNSGNGIVQNNRRNATYKAIDKVKASGKDEPKEFYIPKESYRKFELIEPFDIPPFFEGIPVPDDLIKATISRYRIGYISGNGNNLTLPYIDQDGTIHAVQVKFFDGKKTTKDGNQQYHKLHATKSTIDPDYLEKYNNQKSKYNTCFGANLIRRTTIGINIHESPKNALLTELFKPVEGIVNIAVGGLSFLNLKRLEWIKMPRYQSIEKITLIPDVDGIEQWTNKIEDLEQVTNIPIELVSPLDWMKPYYDGNFREVDYLEDEKLDVADLILDYWTIHKPVVKGIESLLPKNATKFQMSQNEKVLYHSSGKVPEVKETAKNEPKTKPMVFKQAIPSPNLEDTPKKVAKPKPAVVYVSTEEDLIRMAQIKIEYRADWISKYKLQFKGNPRRISRDVITELRKYWRMDFERNKIVWCQSGGDRSIDWGTRNLLCFLIYETEPNLFKGLE